MDGAFQVSCCVPSVTAFGRHRVRSVGQSLLSGSKTSDGFEEDLLMLSSLGIAFHIVETRVQQLTPELPADHDGMVSFR